MGRFRDHQIDKLSIYNDGFLISAQTNTVILDDFIEEAVYAVKNRFSLTEQTIDEPQTVYDSQVVVQGKFSISDGVPRLGAIAQKKLSECFGRYGTEREYSVTGFTMRSDPDKTTRLSASSFSLDRRINVSFEKELYFSEAPLKTDDHLDLLRSLEDD